MTNEVAIPKAVNTSIQFCGMPSTQELMVYQTWAKNAVDSQMYRGIGKESAVMMIMLAAREYGIGPAQALNGGLQIIEGKVELSARIMCALIRKAGHELKIEDGEGFCKVWGRRRDTKEEHEVKYTMEMAQRAGLIKEKGAWRKTPEDMLYNRAISRLARRLFSDVIGIGYVEGEIVDCGASNEELEVSSESGDKNEDEMLRSLLDHFAPEDRSLVIQFFEEVNAHYKEPRSQTLGKMLVDLKVTSDRFYKWKNKRKLDSMPNNEIPLNAK